MCGSPSSRIRDHTRVFIHRINILDFLKIYFTDYYEQNNEMTVIMTVIFIFYTSIMLLDQLSRLKFPTKNENVIIPQSRGVKLILFHGPHAAQFNLKWARPVKRSFLSL